MRPHTRTHAPARTPASAHAQLAETRGDDEDEVAALLREHGAAGALQLEGGSARARIRPV